MRIAVDGMGGDHAPRQIVGGTLDALAERSGFEVQLLGQPQRLADCLAELLPASVIAQLPGLADLVASGHVRLPEPSASPSKVSLPGEATPSVVYPPAAVEAIVQRLKIVPCSQVVGMDDKPTEALLSKPDSSIRRMAELLSTKQVGAVVSAGNTGACVAACQMRVRRLPGVLRPGILVVIPTFKGPAILMDVGANPDPKPEHLHQYAQIATVYAREVLGFPHPKVGTLSIGEEAGKGNRLVKAAYEMIAADPTVQLFGNVEGRDVFRHTTDIVICDGYTGNVVLKLMESIADGIFRTIRNELAELANPDVAATFEPIVSRIWSRHDYAEYGGAPLLGVDGLCIICHGASDARAIKNAVFRAQEYLTKDLNRLITASLAPVAPAISPQPSMPAPEVVPPAPVPPVPVRS